MADIIQAAKWLAEKKPVRGPDTNGGRETYRDLPQLVHALGECVLQDDLLRFFIGEWTAADGPVGWIPVAWYCPQCKTAMCHEKGKCISCGDATPPPMG